MKGRILNYIIYSLFFIIVAILGYDSYALKKELDKGPEIIWKEFRTTEYVEVEKPIEKVVYKEKIVYKNNPTIDYNNDDGVLIIDIGSN